MRALLPRNEEHTHESQYHTDQKSSDGGFKKLEYSNM